MGEIVDAQKLGGNAICDAPKARWSAIFNAFKPRRKTFCGVSG